MNYSWRCGLIFIYYVYKQIHSIQTSILKNRLTEITKTVDSETGEILDLEIKKQGYIANSKEEFFLIYSTLIGVFQKISTAHRVPNKR